MNRIALLLLVVTSTAVAGCGSSEPTVIEPQNYELTEQEQANRERADKAMAAQRQ